MLVRFSLPLAAVHRVSYFFSLVLFLLFNKPIERRHSRQLDCVFSRCAWTHINRFKRLPFIFFCLLNVIKTNYCVWFFDVEEEGYYNEARLGMSRLREYYNCKRLYLMLTFDVCTKYFEIWFTYSICNFFFTSELFLL